MKLEQLLSTLSGAEIRGNTESEIFSLAYDSRQAQEGCLFFCITGFKMDGHAFAGDAVARGARALCVERDVEVPEGIAVIKVPDTRSALAAMSACFYDYPSRKLKMIGVTGTNGKTTTTTLISEVMNRSGIKTGLIGTLFIQMGDIVRTSRVTTPESLDLQSILADHGEPRHGGCGDGSLFSCPESREDIRRILRQGSLYQPDSGSSRLSSQYR